MAALRLLTLPQLAQTIGVEYRTLHSWLGRGLLRPSLQASSGTGSPNLFSIEDAVQAKIIAELRASGISFELLEQVAEHLQTNQTALTEGAVVLVNGSVSVLPAADVPAAHEQESPTLAYDTQYAIREVNAALAAV
jgi:DNA-binding transcriptional MerR regulator